MLTAKENFRECVNGGNPDRYVNQYEALQILFHPAMILGGPMPGPGEMNVTNGWGVTYSWPEGQPGSFPEHGKDKLLVKDIATWRDAVKAPSLDIPDAMWDDFAGQYEAIDNTKAFRTAFFAPGMFEQTHNFCSITEVLMYYMINKQEMHDMIEYVKEYELKVAEGLCEHLHPEAILHHDDWGTESNSFLRPEMFEEFFLEPYKEVYKYYHDHGVEFIVHHSDSYCANILPTMVEMGIDVWQGPMRSNNLEGGLFDEYKGKITFMGNIDNKFVDFEGSTQEDYDKVIEEAVKDHPLTGYIPCICQGGPGSAYEGVYLKLTQEIDKYNAEKFGHKIEDLEAARCDLQYMF